MYIYIYIYIYIYVCIIICRLKQQYEAKGNKPPSDGAPSSSGSALSGSGSSRRTGSAAIKTLPQANLKIKELEDEVEKVLICFYVCKSIDKVM
jgi:hypothetical protein